MNSRKVNFGIAFLLACVLGYYAYQKPNYDWDILAYSAIQYQWGRLDNEQTHQKIYVKILPSLGDSIENFLTENQYERRCATSADYFISQLPFYSVKPLYNGLVYALSKIGLSYLQAMRLISALAYFVLILLIAWMMIEITNDLVATVIGILFCAVQLVLTPARMLTPDLLSSTLIVLAIMLYSLRNSYHVSIVILILSIAVRPDNAATALIALFAIAFFDSQRRRWRHMTLYSAAIFLVFFLIGYLFNGYGWKITFQHSVIDLAKPISYWQNIPLSAGEYFKWALYQVVYSKPLFVPAFLLVGLSFFSIRQLINVKIFDFKLKAIWWALLASAVIKFAAFPRFDLRYYIPQYIFFAMTIGLAIFVQQRKNLET